MTISNFLLLLYEILVKIYKEHHLLYLLELKHYGLFIVLSINSRGWILHEHIFPFSLRDIVFLGRCSRYSIHNPCQCPNVSSKRFHSLLHAIFFFFELNSSILTFFSQNHYPMCCFLSMQRFCRWFCICFLVEGQ